MPGTEQLASVPLSHWAVLAVTGWSFALVCFSAAWLLPGRPVRRPRGDATVTQLQPAGGRSQRRAA